jgi:hypothetical protein
VSWWDGGRLTRCVFEAQHKASLTLNVNVLHYFFTNGSDDPQILADTLRDDVLPSFKALYSNEWTVSAVEVVDEKDPLNPGTALTGVSSGSPGDGTRSRSGDKAPRAECAVVTLGTGFHGRRFRGRLFLGGDIRQADDADGVWLSGQKTVWQTFIDAIPLAPTDALWAGDVEWVVYSRTQRAATLTPFASAVTTKTLRDSVHWLRSRETGP